VPNASKSPGEIEEISTDLFSALTSGRTRVSDGGTFDFPAIPPGTPPSLLQSLQSRQQLGVREQRRLDLSPRRPPPQPAPALPCGPRHYLSESGATGGDAVVNWVEHLQSVMEGRAENVGVVVSAEVFCAESLGCMCGGVTPSFQWDADRNAICPVRDLITTFRS
jgi:hypothetical protein